jgi:hypothetical protein
LLGINLEVFGIDSIDEGDFYVKFRLRNKSDGFHWVLIAVYGGSSSGAQRILPHRVSANLCKGNISGSCGGRGRDFNIIQNP